MRKLIGVMLITSLIWLIGVGIYGQEVMFEGGNLDLSLSLNQSRDVMGILTGESIATNARLTLNFSIADLVRRGSLTITNSHQRPSGNPTGVSDRFGAALSVGFDLSDALTMRINAAGDSTFFPANPVQNSINSSLNIDTGLSISSFQINMVGLFTVVAFPNDLTPQTASNSINDRFGADVSVTAQSRGEGSGVSVRVGQTSTLFILEPEKNESNLSFRSSANGGLGNLQVNAAFNSDVNIASSQNDPAGDANGDGCPGICDVDDDNDGLFDEDDAGNQQTDPPIVGLPNPIFDNSFINDDDEDGLIDEARVTTRFDGNLQTRFSMELLNVTIDLGLNGLSNSDDTSNNKQENNAGVSLSTTLFEVIQLTSRVDQRQTRFSGNSNNDNNVITMALGIRTTVGDLTFGADSRDTFTRFPNNPTDDRIDTQRSISISFPISELVSVGLRPMDFSQTSFPNDLNRADDIRINRSVNINVRLGEFGNAGVSVSQSEFPNNPANNSVSLSLNGSISKMFGSEARLSTSATFSASSSGVSTGITIAAGLNF